MYFPFLSSFPLFYSEALFTCLPSSTFIFPQYLLTLLSFLSLFQIFLTFFLFSFSFLFYYFISYFLPLFSHFHFSTFTPPLYSLTLSSLSSLFFTFILTLCIFLLFPLLLFYFSFSTTFVSPLLLFHFYSTSVLSHPFLAFLFPFFFSLTFSPLRNYIFRCPALPRTPQRAHRLVTPKLNCQTMFQYLFLSSPILFPIILWRRRLW